MTKPLLAQLPGGALFRLSFETHSNWIVSTRFFLAARHTWKPAVKRSIDIAKTALLSKTPRTQIHTSVRTIAVCMRITRFTFNMLFRERIPELHTKCLQSASFMPYDIDALGKWGYLIAPGRPEGRSVLDESL